MLDSHVLLWFIHGTLSREAGELIAERAELALASAASIWEIEIKNALGRLDVPQNFVALVEESSFDKLHITYDHAVEAARLPFHHRDPFDRMLVAQARVEGLTLVSADGALDAYDVPVIGASRADPG